MKQFESKIIILFFLIAGLEFCIASDYAEVKEVKIMCSGMTVKVSDGDWNAGNKKIKVKAAEFKIDPATIVSIENERVTIGDEKPNQYVSSTKLSGVVPKPVTHGIKGCLVPNSVVVKSEEGAIYEEGSDYIIDNEWGAMGRLADGKINKNEKALVDYKYSMQRLDLIQVSADGTLSLKKGEDKKNCPIPPEPDSGNYPVANIFLPFHTAEITDKFIYLIGPAYPEPAKDELEANAKFVSKTLDKLRRGDSVTIVVWGNSVTTGCDLSSQNKGFPQVFLKMLKERFPNADIKLKNAGIAGTCTANRLPALEKEVLRFKPDLVTIEFVNDMGWPDNTVRNNYSNAIDQIRDIGGEVIIITPHFVTPEWMGAGFSLKEGTDIRPLIPCLRSIAEEKEVGLADASKKWEHLASEGIPYTTLLLNGLNHPDSRGHLIFAQELMKFFPR